MDEAGFLWINLEEDADLVELAIGKMNILVDVKMISGCFKDFKKNIRSLSLSTYMSGRRCSCFMAL